jgi:hypothetical protein
MSQAAPTRCRAAEALPVSGPGPGMEFLLRAIDAAVIAGEVHGPEQCVRRARLTAAAKVRTIGAIMRGANVKKVSVSVDADALEWARARAKREGKSLSAVLSDSLRQTRRAEARRRLLRRLGTADLTPAELEAVWNEWQG